MAKENINRNSITIFKSSKSVIAHISTQTNTHFILAKYNLRANINHGEKCYLNKKKGKININILGLF